MADKITLEQLAEIRRKLAQGISLDDALAQLGQCTFSILLGRAPVQMFCAHAGASQHVDEQPRPSYIPTERDRGLRARTSCPQPEQFGQVRLGRVLVGAAGFHAIPRRRRD